MSEDQDQNKIIDTYSKIVGELITQSKQNPKLTLKQFLEELEIE